MHSIVHNLLQSVEDEALAHLQASHRISCSIQTPLPPPHILRTKQSFGCSARCSCGITLLLLRRIGGFLECENAASEGPRQMVLAPLPRDVNISSRSMSV